LPECQWDTPSNLCRSSGQCADTALKGGRCGDWVWLRYMRGGKQSRRRWAKPRDLWTPNQLYWRARLAAASQQYSASLTDAEQDACIAAGSRRRCRPRMGLSGWLTGQQYWIRTQCTPPKTEAKMRHAEGSRPSRLQRAARPALARHGASPRARLWRGLCSTRTYRVSSAILPRNCVQVVAGARTEAVWPRRRATPPRPRGPPDTLQSGRPVLRLPRPRLKVRTKAARLF